MNRAGILVWLLLVVSPGVVSAQSQDVACVADHRSVQTNRTTGHFLEARDAASRCANVACPQLVRQDCAAWYVDLEASLPSLIFEISDRQGHDLADVQVRANGHVLPGAAYGRALAIDPGRYLLQFEATGYRTLERELVVREGGKNRLIAVTMEPLEVVPITSAPQVEHTRRLPITELTLGAVAVAGLATFVGAGVTGRLERHRLEQSHCKPDCSRGDVEHINRLYVAADIAAGAAAAAAIAGTMLFLRDHMGRAEREPSHASLRWDASAHRGGAAVSLAATF